jgi:hypothetical protein
MGTLYFEEKQDRGKIGKSRKKENTCVFKNVHCASIEYYAKSVLISIKRLSSALGN